MPCRLDHAGVAGSGTHICRVVVTRRLPRARLRSRGGTPINAALTLRLPSDGSQRELRSLLDWLDAAGIEADELTVHTPDLDDVFFALTGGADQPHQPEESAR